MKRWLFALPLVLSLACGSPIAPTPLLPVTLHVSEASLIVVTQDRYTGPEIVRAQLTPAQPFTFAVAPQTTICITVTATHSRSGQVVTIIAPLDLAF